MKRNTAMRVRGTTWAFAALCLIAFCWLGLAASRFAPIFQGLEPRLPMDTRLVVTYGAVWLPIFGVVAALVVILSDFFLPRQRLPLALTAVFMLLAMIAFRAVTFSGIFMGPSIRPWTTLHAIVRFLIASLLSNSRQSLHSAIYKIRTPASASLRLCVKR